MANGLAYGDISGGKNLIVEVHSPYGLLLVGPIWVSSSLLSKKSSGRLGGSPQTRDRFWLLRVIRADSSALWRLRVVWNQIAPTIQVNQLSDYELAEAVSDAIVRKQVTALFLSNMPTAAFTAAQDQVQARQHGASGSWDAPDLSNTDTRPVYMWSKEQKVFYALKLAATSSRIPGDLTQVVLGLLIGPTVVKFVATLIVWAGLQLVPGVDLAVDGVAATLAWSLAGFTGIRALLDFISATVDAIQATSIPDLRAVSERYVDDLISLGALFLPKLVSKLNGGGGGNSPSDGSGSQGEAESTIRSPISENRQLLQTISPKASDSLENGQDSDTSVLQIEETDPETEAVSADTITERQATAQAAYESAGWSEDRISDHLSGIDFTKPVDMISLAPDTPVVQYSVPGSSVGNYFAPVGTPASELGINPDGRVPTLFTTSAETSVLRSTAAPITDTWTVPDLPYEASGGGTQYFTTDPQLFNRVP